jgi:hydrogenase maturation factor
MPDHASCCDDMTFCITCSDAAESMRLESIAPDGAVGVCTDALGHRSDVLLGLVPNAPVGVEVLVHAGVALLVVPPASEAAP